MALMCYTWITLLVCLYPYTNGFRRTVEDTYTKEIEVDVYFEGPQQDELQQKRSEVEFPAALTLVLHWNTTRIELSLHRNKHINHQAPVTVERHGNTIFHQIKDEEELAYYYDLESGTSLMVQLSSKKESKDIFEFFGTVNIGATSYILQPPDSHHKTHTLGHVPEDEFEVKTNILENIHEVELKQKTNTIEHFPEVKIKGNPDNAYISSDRSNVISRKIKQIRQRRQTKKQKVYEIEVLMVADFSVYSFWMSRAFGKTKVEKDTNAKKELRQYYALLLNAIDMRYKSVTGKGYEIKLLFAGLHIADTVSGSSWTESIKNETANHTRVNAADALSNFMFWSYIDSDLPGHDHAMLFTKDTLFIGPDKHRYSLYDKQSDDAGLGYIGGLCTLRKTSISMDRFSALDATVAAHELGHNLNAEHDGTGNNCSPSDNYIMRPGSRVTHSAFYNRRLWEFSNCSLDYFDQFIRKLNREDSNCMTTRSSVYNPKALEKYTNDLMGQIYPPDDQCEAQFGNGSFLCRSMLPTLDSWSNYCIEMDCSLPGANNGSCWLTIPWEGTSCGFGKICSRGSCVDSKLVPSHQQKVQCLFGDQPAPFYDDVWYTCEELMEPPKHRLCNFHWKQCCETCNKVANIHNSSYCPYGDKAMNCDYFECDYYDPYQRDNLCCGTCGNNYPLTSPTSPQTVWTPQTDINTETPYVPVCSDVEFYCGWLNKCMPNYYKCDGLIECPDGSDEPPSCRTTVSTTTTTSSTCLQEEFQCKNGQCIAEILRCDHVVDCLDQSDEINCRYCAPNEIFCKDDDICIASFARCDGINDCSSGSDESMCSFGMRSEHQTVWILIRSLILVGLIWVQNVCNAEYIMHRACQNSLCQNNGVCSEPGGEQLCRCPVDYIGSRCQYPFQNKKYSTDKSPTNAGDQDSISSVLGLTIGVPIGVGACMIIIVISIVIWHKKKKDRSGTPTCGYANPLYNIPRYRY